MLASATPSVPAGSLVLAATLQPRYASQTASADATMGVHALTTPFNGQATWNLATGSTLWSTPGGDFEPAARGQRLLSQSDYGQSVGFGVTGLVQDVADGRRTRADMLLKAADETQAFAAGFERFLLRSRYVERTGEAPRQTFERFALSDGSEVAVNIGNGNVSLRAEDVRVESADGTFALGRFFNSLASAAGGTFGARSRGDFGSVGLQRNADDGSYVLYGPGAVDGVFERQPDGSFRAPEGLDATLQVNGDGTLTVDFHSAPERWTFDSATPTHRLVKVTRDYGYEISATYGAAGIASLADTLGNSVSFAYDGTGDMRTATDQNGAIHRYAYDADHRLLTHTTPSDAQTGYSYDGLGRLTRVSLPDGRALKLSYAGTTFKPATITPADASGVDQPATTFAWNLGMDPVPAKTTTVTAPNGERRTYYYGDDLVVDLVQSGDAPALASTGQLPALNGAHDRGAAPYSVDASAADASGGVERIDLLVDGRTGATISNCCSSGYWTRASGSLTYDPRALPEGRHTFTVKAFDGVGATTSPETWTVFIDRTAPLAARGFTSYLDPDTRSAELDWEAGGDPPLADGSPGSGGGEYRFRYRRNGGAWTDWQQFAADGISLPDSWVGEVITIEAQAIDSAGNVGSVISHDFRMSDPPPDRKMTFVIADADARTSYGWTPVLAPGHALRVVRRGAEVVVVDAADVQQYVLTSTSAKDSSERTLDYTYSLNGSQLVVTVDHRVPGVEYPVILDTNRTIWGPVPHRRLVRQLREARAAANGLTTFAESSRDRPNKIEIAMCARYANHCDGFIDDRDKAEWVLEGVFGAGANGEDETRGNAFKHAYWTAIMTGTAGRGDGDTDAAWYMAAAHEANDMKSARSRMDLHNNRVGNDFVASKPYRNSDGSRRYGSDREICRSIRERVAVALYERDQRNWPSRGLVFIKSGGRALLPVREPCRRAG